MRDSRRRQRIQATISQFKSFKYLESAEFNHLPPSELNQFIDHTLLKPEATAADIRKLCEEAKEHKFKTVCVNSSWIELCDSLLGSTTVPVPIAVVGFPLGAGVTAAKSFEAKVAIDAGAKEIDMVIHIGRLKEGDYDYVFQDIKAVYDTCGSDIPLKVILETCKLTHDEIVAACCICKEIGVAFVKTSTGFGGDGATVEHVALMKAVVGDKVQVKASGGIRTYADAIKMLTAGAERIGASASVAIVTEKDP